MKARQIAKARRRRPAKKPVEKMEKIAEEEGGSATHAAGVDHGSEETKSTSHPPVEGPRKADASKKNRDEEIGKMKKDLRRLQLKELILEKKMKRTMRKFTNNQVKMLKGQVDERNHYNIKDIRKAGMELSERMEKSSRGQMAKEMKIKNDELIELMKRYTWAFVVYTWKLVREKMTKTNEKGQTVLAAKTFAIRARFFCPDDHFLKRGYFETMIVGCANRVFGFSTDNHKGIAFKLHEQSDKISLVLRNFIEGFGAQAEPPETDFQLIVPLNSLKVESLAFVKPRWWGVEVHDESETRATGVYVDQGDLCSDFVENGILTEEQFTRTYPTEAEREALRQKIVDTKAMIAENGPKWDEEERNKALQSEARDRYQIEFGKRLPDDADAIEALRKAREKTTSAEEGKTAYAALRKQLVCESDDEAETEADDIEGEKKAGTSNATDQKSTRDLRQTLEAGDRTRSITGAGAGAGGPVAEVEAESVHVPTAAEHEAELLKGLL